MKKRIIASILVVVMLVLTLASCGAFSFAEEDLSAYATFDEAAFRDALTKIEIEDGDFTTNEDTRVKKLAEKIYTSLVSAVTANAKSYAGDKLESGVIGDRDVVYFCYYATDADGNVYMFSNMKESTLTSSDHNVKLGAIDEDDELEVKIAAALKGLDITDVYYSMKTASDLDDKSVKAGDTIVVSFTREYTVKTTGEDGKESVTAYTDKAVYHTITLTAGDAISDILLNTNNTVQVGSSVKVKEGDVTKDTFTIAEEVNGEMRDCTYSSFKIEWLVDKTGTPVKVTHTPYDAEKKVQPDSLYTSGQKIYLNDTELTYHVYPVYRLEIPETGAESILELIVGKNISDTYFEAFENENYKFADDKKLSDIITALKDLWAEKYEADSDLDKKKDAYDAAKKALDDAKKNTATTAADKAALQETLDAAEKAYVEARRAAIKAEIAKILAATNDNADDKSMADAIVEEYNENVRHSLTETYNSEITKAVQKAVWELIDKHVKVTGYPEQLVEDYCDHLYNSYEYKFYKGDYSTSSTNKESNYAHYNGDFDKYLYDAVKAKDHKGDVDAAIKAEAEDAIEPLIKLYVVSKALENDAKAALVNYIQADIDAGAYDANYQDNANLSAKENEKAKEKAEAQAEENKAEALENAREFLITDKVFKDYKKALGSSAYRSYEEQYGEINIRASLQFNRLFYYLTSTNLVATEDGGNKHTEPKYVPVEGKDPVLDFRTVKYSIKVETEDTTNE